MGKQKIVTKQKIITNTVIFIFVMAFILAFKAVFGTENTLIGVSTITATLMLLGRDFTGQPLKNTLMFLGINLLMGVGTAIADMKMGDACATARGCDLTYDYVKINADYRS